MTPITVADDKLRRLAELELFSTDDRLLRAAGRAVELVTVPAGSVLHRRGDRPRWWTFVAAGSAAVEVDGVLTGVLGPGDSVGADAIARRAPLAATVVALTELDVVTVEARRLPGLADRHWGMALQLAMEPPLPVLPEPADYAIETPTASLNRSTIR
ncbi:MAG: cyclic nucleotide-binding domain-containing protein [Acidimicrobiales bacterium]